jgi:hypothetical protein
VKYVHAYFFIKDDFLVGKLPNNSGSISVVVGSLQVSNSNDFLLDKLSNSSDFISSTKS